MAVKTVRKGLNRETQALLEYIRRMAPVNTAYGLPAQVAINKTHMAVDRIMGDSGDIINNSISVKAGVNPTPIGSRIL